MTGDLVVELAFGSTFTTDPDDYVWTDVSDYVEGDAVVSIDRGRGDEFADVPASRCTLTLDNDDGRFTPEYAAGAYYPNVKRSVPLRVTRESDGSVRFTGFVTNWPPMWPDGSEDHCTVTITAATRSRQLGEGSELESMVIEEARLDAPVAYYPLGEATGATQAVDYSGHGRPNLTAASPSLIGTYTGVVTDDLAAAGAASFALPGASQMVPAGATGYTLEAVTSISAPPPDNRSLAALRAFSPKSYGVNLHVTDVSGNLGVIFRGADNTFHEWDSGTPICDGTIHHCAVVVTNAGGNSTARLYVDGALLPDTWAAAPQVAVDLDYLTVGAVWTMDGETAGLDGMLCHVGVYDEPLDATSLARHAEAALTGFVGETSAERFARICEYARAPYDVIGSPGANDMALQKTDGKQPIALLRAVAETEAGVLYEATDAVLTLQTRTHRYGVDAAVSLSVAGQEVEAKFDPQYDDFGMVNEAAVSSSQESVGASRSVDQASINEHGRYRTEVTIVSTSDSEVSDRAAWLVSSYAQPMIRVPSLAVSLPTLSDDQADAVAALQLGDKVTVTQLPAQAPASEMSFFVEGISEQITATSWMTTLNVSPASVYDRLWLLDDPDRSVLDDSTVLAL